MVVANTLPRFLWVEFQLQDLCQLESDYAIRIALQKLPQSLSETFDRLLSKIEGAERTDMIERMFKWIVCARRPLHVDELKENVAFTLDDSEYNEEKVVTNFSRLVRACGNLVVIDKETEIIRLAHYTVQQYLLERGDSRFHFTVEEANNTAGEFCLAYLNFSNFENRVTPYKENMNTDLVTLGKIASQGSFVAPDHPGWWVTQALTSIRKFDTKTIDINMTRHIPRRNKRTQGGLSQYVSLAYSAAHWLWHTTYFKFEHSINGTTNRRDALFRDLVLEKQLNFDFRPWESSVATNARLRHIGLLGWALMANHEYLIKIAFPTDRLGQPANLLLEAWQWLLEREPRPRKKLLITQRMLDALHTFSEDSYLLQLPALGVRIPFQSPCLPKKLSYTTHAPKMFRTLSFVFSLTNP